MEVVHSRCAGLDISKKDAKVCVRVAGAGRRKTVETVTTWSSMTNQILALREHLIAERITSAVMEATGDYWKPFYYLLEDAGFEVVLVNARHVKNLPGRKTDVSDATWLAQPGAHRLVRGSFVPPEPIRQLRDLTRARTAITRERGREAQRLEKLLEDAGIKLSAVASDVMGVSGRAMRVGAREDSLESGERLEEADGFECAVAPSERHLFHDVRGAQPFDGVCGDREGTADVCGGRGHGEDREGRQGADEQVHGGVRSHPAQARPAVGVELGEVTGEAVGVVAGASGRGQEQLHPAQETRSGVALGTDAVEGRDVVVGPGGQDQADRGDDPRRDTSAA